jgi:hypothetical protein
VTNSVGPGTSAWNIIAQSVRRGGCVVCLAELLGAGRTGRMTSHADPPTLPISCSGWVY